MHEARRIHTFLVKLFLVYLGICLTVAALQRHIIYHPLASIDSPQTYGLSGYEDVRMAEADGTRIDAWYHPARPAYPTLLFFHGNGGNIASRTDYFQALADAGFGVFAADYRGYGASTGSPSEAGLYADANTAMQYLLRQKNIPPGRVIIYGESIGTGVAVETAKQFPAGALVLQSPFTSLEDVAKDRFAWLPVHFLLWDRFDSQTKIGELHMPLLLFHGEQDTIIPAAQGKALFARANAPKKAVYFPSGGHNDLGSDARIRPLLAFCRAYGLIKE